MEEFNRIKLLAIVGPTACKKSDLAIWLAKKIDGEIVSADSMQIYKEMDIATAKPSKEQLQEVKHHLINILNINELFSVADFVKIGNEAIKEIHSRKKIPIVVGGTGLYVKSLLEEINFIDYEIDSEIEEAVEKKLKTFGPECLLKDLKKLDSEYSKNLHPNNVKRIVRALKLNLSTGLTMKQISNLSLNCEKKFDVCYVGLTYFDRKNLYASIENRVDEMLSNGLLEEAKKILNGLKINSTAMQAIGYKELNGFFEGRTSLNESIKQIKKNTKRFAKRQLTWFRRDEKINWLFLDKNSLEEIKDEIFKLYCQHFNLN